VSAERPKRPAKSSRRGSGAAGSSAGGAEGEFKAKTKKKGLGIFGIMLVTSIALAVIAVGAVAGGYVWLTRSLDAPGPTSAETVVQLERGLGLNAIAMRLETEGVIADQYVFRAGAILEGAQDSLRFGEYAVPAGASMREVLALLASGRVVEYAVTVPEGLTSKQIVDIINASELLTGEIASVPPEGALLPETYRVMRGSSRQELIDRMAQAQSDLIAQLWPGRDENLPYTTIEEAIIAASIIEKETGRADERGKVAAVVRNRLALPMRLQMDSTIIYGEWLEDQSRPLNVEPRGPELGRPENLYNTYTHDGLPPGPIANPGRDAIAATLSPEPTAEGGRPILYFIASCAGDGTHNFSSSLRDHERYRAEWRRCRNALRAAANE
jgi:UPF0755 protein